MLDRSPPNSELEKYKALYQTAYAARSNIFKERKNAEEFYYNDVEHTYSEFTKKQKTAISDTYNIPISTKITYPIIEQIISFLTGNKPYPKVVSPSRELEEFAITYQKAFDGIWHESGTEHELAQCIRDGIVTGSGFIRVRKDNFYNESTFNVIHEYVKWSRVIVDPHSKKMDFSDAQYVIINDILPKKRAEQELGVKLKESDHNFFNELSWATEEDYYTEFYTGYGLNKNELNKHKYVLIREFYEQINVNVYLSENGDITTKRPKTIEIPNIEKQKLRMQIEELTATLQETGETEQKRKGMETDDLLTAFQSDSPTQHIEKKLEHDQMSQENEDNTNAMNKQIQQMQASYYNMPDTIQAYKMTMEETKEEKIVREVTRVKKKRMLYTLIAGDTIVEKKYIDADSFPIVHFCIQHNQSPNKTYGMIHYIKDLAMAMNKFWSSMIYDAQINNNTKIIVAEGSVIDINALESQWSKPGGVIQYRPNETLPDGGRPMPVPPNPLSQASVQLIQMLTQMVEYITGINSLMQGRPDESQQRTMGAINSMQNFGSQRVKLYSRWLQKSLENLTLSTVYHVKKYTPKNEVLMYLDDNGDAVELKVLEDNKDIKYKVRVDVTSALPSVKQMTSQLLGIIAGQTKNPYVADFLTKNMLENSDLPNGKKLSKQIDTIKQMGSQIQQLSEQLKEKENQNKSLVNNYQQKQMSHQVDQVVGKAKEDIGKEKQKQIDNLQQMGDTNNVGTGDDEPIF